MSDADKLKNLAQLLPGLGEMLNGLEAVRDHLKALAEDREPDHDDEVLEWAENLLADLGTVEAEIAEATSTPAATN